MNLQGAGIGAGAGVCIVNEDWQQQHKPVVDIVVRSGYKLRVSRILPDIIVCSSGVSVAFVVITSFRGIDSVETFSHERLQKVTESFKNAYVLCVMTSEDDTSRYNDLCCDLLDFNGEAGRLPVIAVSSTEAAMEKVFRLVHVHSECRRQATVQMVDTERTNFVHAWELKVATLTAIPDVSFYEADNLLRALGTIEAVSSASPEIIHGCTGLSLNKAETIANFFRDDQCNLAPKLL